MKRIERSLAIDSDGDAMVSAGLKPRRSFLWRCSCGLFSLCILLVIVAGGVFVVLRGGVDSEMLRHEAQTRLSAMLGHTAVATIAGAAVSFDQNGHIALEARDVAIVDAQKGIDIKGVRSVRLGLSPLPLLVGQVRVAQLELNGANIRLPEGRGGNLLEALPVDDRGLVDFDAVSKEIFKIIDGSVDILAKQETDAIGIFDSTITFRSGGADQTITIKQARLFEKGDQMQLVGQIGWKDRIIGIQGSIDRKINSDDLDGFRIDIDNIPLIVASAPEVAPRIGDDRVNPAHFELAGAGRVSLTGRAAANDSPEQLSVDIGADNINLEIGRATDIKGQLLLSLNHEVGSGKIEIRPSRIALGGFNAEITGAFGPEPASEDNQGKPAYRFEVVTSSANSRPLESSDPEVPFAVRIGGRFLQDEQRLQFANLDVKTPGGELYGQGSMAFGAGSPEMIFMLRIPKMPVAEAKHLWPVDVADGAREWVLKNLFGGTLFDSRIDVALPAGRFNGPGLPAPLTGEEIKADFNVSDTRFDVVGELPPVRDADGSISVRGAHTTILLKKGSAYTTQNRQVNVSDGTLIIPWGPQRPVIADVNLRVTGDAAAVAEIIDKKPIDALKDAPFTSEQISGDVDARVKVGFAVSKNPPPGTLTWSADVGFSGVAITKPINGSLVTNAKGNMAITQTGLQIEADALLSGMPAKITMTEPVGRTSTVKRQQSVRLEIDDKARARAFPGLNSIFSGTMSVNLGMTVNGKRQVVADLSKTQIELPWLGWKKGSGVAAKATFDLIMQDGDNGNVDIRNLDLVGDAFRVSGDLSVVKNNLKSAKFTRVKLNRNDDLSVKVTEASGGFRVDAQGSSFDARALIRQFNNLAENSSSPPSSAGKTRVVVNAQIGEVGGFNGEVLRNVAVSYETAGAKVSSLSVNATTGSGKSFVATNSNQAGAKSTSLQSKDAGAILRFFDFYAKMHGGQISVGLASQGDGPLVGQVDARNFSIIDEPRLASIVSSSPQNGGTSLSQAVKRDIDVSRVDFERGYALVEKGDNYLRLAKGVFRGPVIGTTFQGTVFDANGNMSMTGTFMPAYGVNRLFGELPILGALLGNGRDRGLIGITYKLSGSAKQPQVTVNPISVIAPGIFRSIFEF